MTHSMPAPDLRPESLAALAALRAALPIVRDRRGADDVRTKAPLDIVTGTDLAVQATIERILAEHHPDCAFVGEEGSAQVPDAGRYWLVDPLCGTSNYSARVPFYALNIALVENGQVTLAAIADGGTGDLYVAERGGGAWLLGSEGATRVRASASSALVSLDPNLGGPDSLRAFGREFAMRVLASGRWDVRMLASTLVLAYLSTGRLAAAVYAAVGPRVHLAAGLLLTHEAGAIVTGASGAEWNLRDDVYVVAATSDLHHELLVIAQAVVTQLQKSST